MKSVEFQAAGRQSFRIWREAWSAEGAGGAKAGIVNQDQQNVWRSAGGRNWVIAGYLFSGSLASYNIRPVRGGVGDGKNGSLDLILVTHEGSFLS